MTKFYGRKLSKIGVNVANATDNQLILKEDYDTGTTTYYDGSGNKILETGLLDDGTYGFSYFNSNGILIAKSNGPTDFKYDANGVNYYQNGLLPDGTYGLVIAAPGVNVADLF